MAGLLSWLVPGLGQLYNGRPSKALLWVAVLLVSVPVAYRWMLAWDAAPWNVLLPIAFLLGIIAWIVADAALAARRSRTTPWYHHWYVYVILGAAYLFVGFPLSLAAIRKHIAQTYQVPTTGMQGTILRGDHIIVDKAAYRKTEPNRNDVAVFSRDSGPFVQRIVAVPGDLVEIQAKRLLVNGHAPDEPYALHIDATIFEPCRVGDRACSEVGILRDHFGPFRVPAATYFLLGDNRDNSFDSRFRGPVPAGNLLGRARRIYWSRDPETRRIRWKRVGQSIR